jgi:hypothetical protein
LVDTAYTVTWITTGGSGDVKIKLSTDGGSTFPITLEASITDVESYNWTPTADHCGTQTVIRIEDAADDTIYGETSAMVVATTTPGTVGSGAWSLLAQAAAAAASLELTVKT